MIPQTPRAAGLSHSSWHTPQKQALEWFSQRTERVLLLDGPTATGKTDLIKGLLAITGESLYACAWSIALQDQHVSMLNIPRIVGRRNFRCSAEEGETCEWNYCKGTALEKDCPFVRQLEEGLKSPITSLNYAVLLTYLNSLPRRPWLVCDEGHVLEDALDNHLAVELDRIWFEEIDFPVPLPEYGTRESLVTWAQSVRDMVALPRDTKQAKRWERGKALAEKAGAAGRDDEYIVHDNGYVITARVLWPLPHFKRVFDRFSRILIMSATLGDTKVLGDTLTEDTGDYATLALGSTIPEENRPIYVRPISFLKKGHTRVDMESMARGIIVLATKHFSGQRGLVHVSSYELARKLGKCLQEEGLGDRVVIETKKGNHRREWEQRFDAPILVTPAAALGMDLPHLFSWQVIAKSPYPDLGDPLVVARANLDPGWYARRTAVGVVQMAGRVARNPQDTGHTIITDAGFEGRVFKRARNSFPEWFTKAMR